MKLNGNIGVVGNKHYTLAENGPKTTKSRPFYSVKSENLKNAGNGLKCIEKQKKKFFLILIFFKVQ